MSVHRLLPVLALTLAVPACHWLSPPSLRVYDSGLHYSFVVPGAWTRVSLEVEAEIRRKMAESSGKAKLGPADQPHLDAAFQRRPVGGEDAPSLMVQHEERAGVTVTDLAQELAAGFPGEVKEVFDELGLREVGAGAAVDHRRGLIVVPSTQAANGKSIRVATIMKPGRRIIVNVALIGLSKQGTDTPEFRAILDSLRFDPGYEAAGGSGAK